MKIITIVGARPQFIKAAVLSREIIKRKGIKEIIIHTGQHYDKNMSAVFFEEMNIPKPDYNLNINGLTHGAMTGQMLEKIEAVLIKEKPDWVLVYGDTNSTLAGALAAKKLHIKLAHVEAGLRSFNMKMPEEVNRILTDRISDILFCPTAAAITNLDKEGYKNIDTKILLSGDVMEDAANFYRSEEKKPKGFKLETEFILSTVHRAENTDDKNKLTKIFNTLSKVSKTKPVVLPLHPRTKSKLIEFNIKIDNSITILPPVSYLEMVYLLNNSKMVITDSGGVQKEAFFFKKPCITLREETEWVELIEHGFNKIAGSNPKIIEAAILHFNTKKLDFDINLYGQGTAAKNIIENLKAFGQHKVNLT